MAQDELGCLMRAAAKYRRTAEAARREGIIPYRSEGGKWLPSPYEGNSWCTGGFWPGLMWQLWHLTGDEFFKAEAKRTGRLLTDELRTFTGLHHDVGFMYLLSCGAEARLCGDEQARADTLHAASLLMGRFNPVGFIRAWNGESQKGYAIIDSMMSLPLLCRASRETGDPRFEKVAVIHADTVLREFFRENGSVSHIIEFDPQTGRRVAEHAGQGAFLGSSWSRGQAWGLYGFTLMYMNTGLPRYLNAARRIAGYFIAHIRPDGLCDCDLEQPEETERLDNIAGAIAACALTELATLTDCIEYGRAADRLMEGMLTRCVDWEEDEHLGLLTRCTASYHGDEAGTHTNIVYGDFFFIEALARRAGKNAMLWL